MSKKTFHGFILSLIIFIASSGPVFAETLGGLESTASTARITDGVTDPTTTAATIISWALSFVGVLFLILMIYGGTLWMVAGGNDEQIKTAQKVISSAAIGLIIILSAYAITQFIGGSLGV